MNESKGYWKPLGKSVWWIDLVYFLNRSGNEFEVELNDVINKIKILINNEIVKDDEEQKRN